MAKSRRTSKTQSNELERVARLAAQRGATVLRDYYLRRDVGVRHKGAIDLVTKADLASQKAIVSTIQKAFPQHLILAEEDSLTHELPLDGPIWIIDPLDGTTNFAHRFPVFGISIAFRDEAETKLGLILQPLLKECFVAHKNGGAFLNGKRIHVSKTHDLQESLLATGFPYDRRISKNNNLRFFNYFEINAQCVRRPGAAAIDLASVSRGHLDGFWEPQLKPWDIAAGILLVEEAGGVVTDYSGKRLTDLRCNEILASNGKIHSQMLKAMKKASKLKEITLPTSAFSNP